VSAQKHPCEVEGFGIKKKYCEFFFSVLKVTGVCMYPKEDKDKFVVGLFDGKHPNCPKLKGEKKRGGCQI